MLVAPLAGAWIEIPPYQLPRKSCIRSHPSRVRGLKSIYKLRPHHSHQVAPLAGAWIEIPPPARPCAGNDVAPLAGAWIEIISFKSGGMPSMVAPLAGAWIEIVARARKLNGVSRRTPRGCVD